VSGNVSGRLEILDDRSIKTRPTLVGSQPPVAHWLDGLGDPTVADAILDRLVHCAYKITSTGESMRKRPMMEDPALAQGDCREDSYPFRLAMVAAGSEATRGLPGSLRRSQRLWMRGTATRLHAPLRQCCRRSIERGLRATDD
jgi:hypothetical protein